MNSGSGGLTLLNDSLRGVAQYLTIAIMRVCENGHFIGDESKTCGACGEKVTAGRKVSLFLPAALHRELSTDAKTVGESLSAQIVRHIHRDRNRRRPAAAARKVKGA